MANAWRTVPVLGDVARLIRIGAPDAMILNAVAPLGITTRLLLDEELPAVGICELPLVTREQLLGSHEGQSGLAYAGLNHLGWFWATDETGQRALAAGVDNGLIDRQVLEEFDAAPLHYYYDVFRPEAGRRLGRVRRENRAGELTSLAEKIFDDLRRRPGADISSFAGRPTPWFDRALIPTLAALLTGSRFHSFANVRNGDLVPAVPTAGVVEVEAEVTAEGVRTLAPQRIPEPVTRFLRAAGEAEALTYRSACERDPSLLIDAMRALPLAIPEVHVKNLAQEIVAPVEPPAA
jgi:6-phospho-beta-glucosidase